MTYKDYSNANSHLPLATIRANWGKIQKAVQSDLASRFGDLRGAKYKQSGKVRVIDGTAVVTMNAVKLVQATAADIKAERQRNAADTARRDGKLKELLDEAIEDGRKGLDLVALVKSNDIPVEDDLSPAKLAENGGLHKTLAELA